MTEEPYRWLEAVANRREYVREQLKGGSPVLAASLPDGILLLGVGGGQSKVFELFDRHAWPAWVIRRTSKKSARRPLTRRTSRRSPARRKT
jgi:hypothetical protein